jgi:tetratricopeptide (TPR) repeat protein
MNRPNVIRAVVALAAVLALSVVAGGGTGISSISGGNLPSQQLGSGFFGSRGSQFAGRYSGAPTGPLAVNFGTSPTRLGSMFSASRFDFTDLRKDLKGLRLRTIESFALRKRAHFMVLQRTTMALAEKTGGRGAPVLVHKSFFQFVFPFGLRDKAAKHGYGVFCLGCLKRGIIRDSEDFLAEFSEEAQETISDEAFTAAVASMIVDGRLPEGKSLDAFYDSQLAAMGNYVFANRRYKAAADVWAVLVKRDASSSLYALAQGHALLAARRFEKASDALRRSLTLADGWTTPEFRITGTNLQNIYTEAADLGETRTNLEALVKNEPENKKLSFLMAYVDLFHGLWKRADTRLAALASGGDAEAAELLKLLRKKRVDDSLRRPFADEDTLSADDVSSMSTDVLLSGEERLELVNGMLKPETFQNYMNLGDFHFFMGNYSRAAESYAAAAQLDPDKVIAKITEVHAAFANGEFSFAATRLREVLKAEPNLGLFNFRIEEFFGNRRDMDKRLTDLEHLIALNPDNTRARMLLGYVYYFDGRFADASEVLAGVVKTSPEYQVADGLLKLARLQS